MANSQLLIKQNYIFREVKRNFFNTKQIYKKFGFPNGLTLDQKISFYRTVSIVRKICLVRRHQMEILKQSVNLVQKKYLQKFMRLKQLNKKKLLVQTQQALEQAQELPICFFLVIYADNSMNKQKFLDKFSAQERNFLNKHCQYQNATINLIVVLKEKQNEIFEEKMSQMKSQMEKKIDNKFSEMQKNIDRKFAEMEDKMQKNIDTKFAKMKDKMEKMMSEMVKQILSSKKQT